MQTGRFLLTEIVLFDMLLMSLMDAYLLLKALIHMFDDDTMTPADDTSEETTDDTAAEDVADEDATAGDVA